MDLLITLVGVQIGAPYKIIGLTSESNKVVSALKDNFDRIIVRFKPRKARIDFILRLSCAVLSSPDWCKIIPK